MAAQRPRVAATVSVLQPLPMEIPPLRDFQTAHLALLLVMETRVQLDVLPEFQVLRQFTVILPQQDFLTERVVQLPNSEILHQLVALTESPALRAITEVPHQVV
jgi:hypothetical protein